MSNVVALRTAPHVVIWSGLCIRGDQSLTGRWIHTVELIEGEGIALVDYVGTDRHAADAAAVDLARDYGCRIIGKSTEEPA